MNDRLHESELAEHLLQAGQELVVEQTHGFSPVRLADACVEAGLRPSGAYRVWANQREFDEDLMQYLLDRNRMRAPDAAFDVVLDVLELDGGSFSGVVKVVIPDNVRAIEQGRTFKSFLAVLPAVSNPSARAAIRGYYDAFKPTFVRIYRVVMNRFDRRLRPGATNDGLFAALDSVAHGFAVFHLQEPGLAYQEVEVGGDTWTYSSLAARAFIGELTESIHG